MQDVPNNVKVALQTWTKILSMHVRNKLEDFHVKHLSDEQMRELNPIVRQGIYEALRHIYMMRKGDQQQKLVGAYAVHHLILLLPAYWENPELSAAELSEEAEFAAKLPNVPSLSTESSVKELETFVKNQIGVFA